MDLRTLLRTCIVKAKRETGTSSLADTPLEQMLYLTGFNQYTTIRDN